MKIIFFGSSEFAVESLNKILKTQKHKVICVVTQADKKQGRGLKLVFTPVKEAAIKNNLKIYQPQDLHSSQTLNYLKELDPELFVVVSYGKILPKELLEIPKIFAINLHASLLPKYRGAAPINWAIINAETQTGVTIIKLNPRMDAGEIILQKQMPIEDTDTNISLEKKLAILGSDLVIEAIDLITNNKHKLVKQDETVMSLAPLMKKENGLIRWDEPAQKIYNLIRGSLRWPGAYTHYQDKIIKIWEAGFDYNIKSNAVPGEIIGSSKEGIVVKTGEGNLLIKKLQPESGKIMPAYDFLQGHKIKIGDRLL